jgi:ABC-2 type transport system permease protein
MTSLVLPVATLWWREVVRFSRQRSRVVGAFGQPLVLWLLLGGGLSASFRPPGAPQGMNYVEYFYPGIIALTILFTAIFATISTVEDRREGFLSGVLVAPVGRSSIVLGQALGGTTLAVFQGLLVLFLAPAAGISLTFTAVVAVIAVMCLVAFGLTSLGLLIAWRMDSTQGFHAIMNLILLPMWLLSGAFFPVSGVPSWLEWVMRLNPLTYGMAALRHALYLGGPGLSGPIPSPGVSLLITVGFAVLTYIAATRMASRKAT